MNMRSVILIIAALVVAGVTAMLARSWLNAERPVTEAVAETAPAKEIQILVAATNLPAGRILQEGDLAWQKWPDVALPEPYIRRVTGKEAEDLIGSVVRTGIRMAEPVTGLAVVKSGERGFLAAVLSPGMRAVSIRISATTGVSGFVFPGDRVDLLLTHSIQGKSRTNHATETVLTNVRVIGVDQRADDQKKAPATVAKTVTLEVTPAQAEKVALASEIGDLALSLRSLADTDAVSGDEASFDGGPPAPGNTHTWDSDVSRILSRTGPAGPSIQVSRGSSTERVSLGGVQ